MSCYPVRARSLLLIRDASFPTGPRHALGVILDLKVKLMGLSDFEQVCEAAMSASSERPEAEAMLQQLLGNPEGIAIGMEAIGSSDVSSAVFFGAWVVREACMGKWIDAEKSGLDVDADMLRLASSLVASSARTERFPEFAANAVAFCCARLLQKGLCRPNKTFETLSCELVQQLSEQTMVGQPTDAVGRLVNQFLLAVNSTDGLGRLGVKLSQHQSMKRFVANSILPVAVAAAMSGLHRPQQSRETQLSLIAVLDVFLNWNFSPIRALAAVDTWISPPSSFRTLFFPEAGPSLFEVVCSLYLASRQQASSERSPAAFDLLARLRSLLGRLCKFRAAKLVGMNALEAVHAPLLNVVGSLINSVCASSTLPPDMAVLELSDLCLCLANILSNPEVLTPKMLETSAADVVPLLSRLLFLLLDNFTEDLTILNSLDSVLEAWSRLTVKVLAMETKPSTWPAIQSEAAKVVQVFLQRHLLIVQVEDADDEDEVIAYDRQWYDKNSRAHMVLRWVATIAWADPTASWHCLMTELNAGVSEMRQGNAVGQARDAQLDKVSLLALFSAHFLVELPQDISNPFHPMCRIPKAFSPAMEDSIIGLVSFFLGLAHEECRGLSSPCLLEAVILFLCRFSVTYVMQFVKYPQFPKLTSLELGPQMLESILDVLTTVVTTFTTETGLAEGASFGVKLLAASDSPTVVAAWDCASFQRLMLHLCDSLMAPSARIPPHKPLVNLAFAFGSSVSPSEHIRGLAKSFESSGFHRSGTLESLDLSGQRQMKLLQMWTPLLQATVQASTVTADGQNVVLLSRLLSFVSGLVTGAMTSAVYGTGLFSEALGEQGRNLDQMLRSNFLLWVFQSFGETDGVSADILTTCSRLVQSYVLYTDELTVEVFRLLFVFVEYCAPYVGGATRTRILSATSSAVGAFAQKHGKERAATMDTGLSENVAVIFQILKQGLEAGWGEDLAVNTVGLMMPVLRSLDAVEVSNDRDQP